MKKIVKTHAPQSLRDWCNKNKELNHSYKELCGSQEHKELKEKLFTEQGQICAYTGRRIYLDDTDILDNWHVEHIKPQNQCAEWEDVDYRNIVACFPVDGGDTSYGYGAPVKGGWWDESLFVSPLSGDCERRFRFTWSGQVYPNPETHKGAKKTIEILKLDNKDLQNLRKARIDGFFGFGSRTQSRPLSIPDAKRTLEIIEKYDGNGRLSEFCFVLKQLLQKYIKDK